MHKVNILIKQIVIFLMIWAVLLLVYSAEAQMNLFKIGKEKQISTTDMDCNYQSEDHWKSTYDFDYPKIILKNDSIPLIAFVDEKSKQLFLAEISNQDSKIIYKQPSHDIKSWRRWPIIFEKENKIYFAQLSVDSRKSTSAVIVFLFDQPNKKLNFEEEKVFELSPRCYLWGVYPCNSNFMLIGKCRYNCLRHIPLFLLGGPPIFNHNASFTLNSHKDTVLERHSIEEQGCYNVFNEVYV